MAILNNLAQGLEVNRQVDNTFDGTVVWNDTKIAQFGDDAAENHSIYHLASDLWFVATTAGTSDLHLSGFDTVRIDNDAQLFIGASDVQTDTGTSNQLLWRLNGDFTLTNASGSHDVKLQVDNMKAFFGAGDDASIYYDGTDMKIKPNEVGTGEVDITGGSMTFEDSEGIFLGNSDDYKITTGSGGLGLRIEDNSSLLAQLDINGLHLSIDVDQEFRFGSSKLEETSGGDVELTLSGVKDLAVQSTNGIHLQDNGDLKLGTGKDAYLYYDGTNLVIDPAVVGSGYIDTNGGDIKVDHVALGGDNPATGSLIEASPITSSTVIGILNANLTYQGSGVGTQGCFAATMTQNGDGANPDVFGALCEAEADSTESPQTGVKEYYGGRFTARQTVAVSGGFSVDIGGEYIIADGGNTHSGGTLLMWGLRSRALPTLTTSGGTQTGGCALFEDDCVIVDDKKLYFEGAVLAGPGDTYCVYDSTGNTWDLFVDNTEVFNANSTDVTVPVDFTVAGELKGARCLLDGGNNTAMSASGYLKFNNGTAFSATQGFRMARAGSIVGVSVQFLHSANTVDGSLDIEVHKNGSNVFSTSRALVAGTVGTDIGAEATQARDTDTFVAGDVLTLYINFTSGTNTIDDTCAVMELQFDT